MMQIIRHGTCYWCMNNDLDILDFDGQEMCSECSNEQFSQRQLEANNRESCLRYESEEWLPEDEFD